jgi:hypothetical protein
MHLNTVPTSSNAPGAKMDATKKRRPAELPAIDAELLYGTPVIARWLGMTLGQARHLIDDGTLPTFRPPGRTIRCACKSQLNEVVREWSRRERR